MTRAAAALLLALGALPAAADDEGVRLQAAMERVDAYVAGEMRRENAPGLALALTDRHGLLRVATYGFADVKARAPVTPETLFEIGSVSKSFTAMALMQLRDEGRFDPQAPIVKYLPWFSVKTAFAPITGHHLLTHTSGLPADRDDIPSSAYQAYAVRERETGYAPGTRWAYSNVGFQVLGYALEAIEGKPYARIIEQRIFQPLGLTASATEFTHATRPRLATGYVSLYDDRPFDASQPLEEATWLEYGAGDGSLVMTPAELAAWVRLLLNRGALPDGRRLVSEQGFALMTGRGAKTGEDPDEYYGYGIARLEKGGRLVLTHSGGMIGYTTRITADMDAGLGVAVVTNTSAGRFRPSAVADFALREVRAALAGEALPPLPEDRSRAVAKAADYAGVFTAPDGRTLELRAAGDALYLVRDGARLALAPRGDDAFLVPDPAFARFLLRFGREQGQVVEASWGPDWYAGTRYAGPRSWSPPSQWLAYPGHYRTTHAWFNNFRVVLRKGRLWLATPDDEESELVPIAPGLFKIGTEPTAERLRLDSLVDGKALRANVSGCDYYRSFVE